MFGYGLMLLAVYGLGVSETIGRERRRRIHPLTLWRSYGYLMRHRLFLGYLVIQSSASAGTFAFISASPTITVDVFNIPETYFWMIFAAASSLLAFFQLCSGGLAGYLTAFFYTGTAASMVTIMFLAACTANAAFLLVRNDPHVLAQDESA